jgi:deoxycytidylate deaminase
MTFVPGCNDCDNPQPTCPRSETDDYSKCVTVCEQQGHAEIQALRRAQRMGIDLRGATAYIYGHYWMCQDCGKALRDAGVTKIVIEERP